MTAPVRWRKPSFSTVSRRYRRELRQLIWQLNLTMFVSSAIAYIEDIKHVDERFAASGARDRALKRQPALYRKRTILVANNFLAPARKLPTRLR
jgi:hypothetical protein